MIWISYKHYLIISRSLILDHPKYNEFTLICDDELKGQFRLIEPRDTLPGVIVVDHTIYYITDERTTDSVLTLMASHFDAKSALIAVGQAIAFQDLPRAVQID